MVPMNVLQGWLILSCSAGICADEAPLSSWESVQAAAVVAETNSPLQKYVAVAISLPLHGCVAAAMESGRPELERFCFENYRTAFAFDEAVSKLPESARKEDLMLMMLRTKSTIWNEHSSGMQRWPGCELSKQACPFRAMVEKYLPNQRIDETVTSTVEARSALADKIEAARKRK